MNASDATVPVLRPYLPATADFAAGRDSPRDFLERCLAALDAWEPRVGAFVTLNLAEARAAADRSAARWRAGNPLSPIDGMRWWYSLNFRALRTLSRRDPPGAILAACQTSA